MSVTHELPGTRRDPLYPDSDGEPMSETDLHTMAVIALRQAFEDLFAARGLADAYVASQLAFYYRQGNPPGRRDPDVLIALGAGSHWRRSFRVWEEGRVPNVVFEISSENTVGEDVGTKRTIYEQQRIPEYFLFDPEEDSLNPSLQGFCLDEQNHYQPIVPNEDGSLDSPRLNVRLFRDGTLLRVLDLATGEVVLTRGERAEDERQRAEDERQRAEDERQRAENEKQLKEAAERRAADEKRLKEDAERRAADEKQRAEDEKKLKEDAERHAADEKKLREDADRRAADEKKLREDADRRAEDEKKLREELQAELDRVKALLDKKD